MDLVDIKGIPAGELKEGDQIVLTVGTVERTATGYVQVWCDTALGRSNLFVMPPTQPLRVAR